MVVSCRRREKKSDKYQKRGKKRRLKHSKNLANLQEFLSFKQLFQLVIPENTSYFFLPRASLDEICSRTHFTTCYKAHVCRLPFALYNRDFKIQRSGRQQERQKNNWFNKPEKQLRTCITLFWTFFFLFLHDHNVKMPNFAFYGGRKQAATKFYFSFLSFDMVPWNSASGRFAYFWQSKWVGIIAIKTEKTQIHLLSDVLVAVATLDLKVRNESLILILN